MNAIYIGKQLRLHDLSLVKGNLYHIEFDSNRKTNSGSIWIKVFYPNEHRYQSIPYFNLDTLYSNWAKDTGSIFTNKFFMM